STFEEMALAKALTNALGSSSIDAGLRHDAALNFGTAKPWLGASVEEVGAADAIVVVGADLRMEQPLFANRIRQASRQGAAVALVAAGLSDPYIPKAVSIAAAPSRQAEVLAQSDVADVLAQGDKKFILIGQQVLMSLYANSIVAAAQDLAKAKGAVLGFLGDGANWVGSFVAGVQASAAQASGQESVAHGCAVELLASPHKAVILVGHEPELDSLGGSKAKVNLHSSDFVVSLTAYAGQATEYADVLLPIAPFTETSGTFINMAGMAQTFKATVKPLGECRPAWKVLRVLGNLLGFEQFEFNSTSDVLDRFLPPDWFTKLNNVVPVAASSASKPQAPELAAYVPLYHSDSIVRRAASLQKTKVANAPLVQANAATLAGLGVSEGDEIELTDTEGGSLIAKVGVNPFVANEVLMVPLGKTEVQSLKVFAGEVQAKALASTGVLA
ncbi:MAG: molybdopterin-dependent oxidoreductase, partial [Limnobacter sp.]|nr:molybdopterin-dependent oxidoreductase [Limnobacter sp.]